MAAGLPPAAVGRDGQLLTDVQEAEFEGAVRRQLELLGDRKSTRLNSSH